MLAASLPRTITPSEGAELPLAAICLFEEVAAGKDLFQQTYGRAPCLCLTGPALFSVRTLALIPHVNIRMIDALRSHISDIGSLDTNSAQVPYFELFAKVSKNKTPVHIRCPAEGFLQSTRLWAESHVRTLHALRQPFLFRQHMSPRGFTRNFLRATAWGPETVMKKDHLISSFYALLELPPLNLSRTAATLMNIKGHGSRHAALNLTRAMKWERVLRNEFGTWKSNAADEERLQVSRSTAKSQSCSTMSDSYSRNIPALNNGCQIRLKLIRTIQRFLGNREWREMIPVTSDYSFLPGASFTDIQLSDDELSSDEEDHEVE